MSDQSSNNSTVYQLEKKLEENPQNVWVLSELAQILANRGDYTGAGLNYEKIISTDEENGKAWAALGHCYLLEGEYQKCFTAYQRAFCAMQENRDPQLWYGIALLYTKFENYNYAEPAFQTVLRIDPSFEQKHEVLYKLGKLYKKIMNYENSITYFRSCLPCQNLSLSRKIEVLCLIGSCYELQDKLEEALTIYNEALKLDETNFKTQEYLGWINFLLKQYEAAIAHFKDALQHVKSSSAEAADINYLLGRCYLAQGILEPALAHFQEAIYKNPHSHIFWCSVGILYACAMQAQDAFNSFVKASNIYPECAITWLNMGVLYDHCGQKQEAALAFQRVYNLDSQLGLACRNKILAGEDTDCPPQFVHPSFEISKVPFSLKQYNKPLKPLPDINNKPADLPLKTAVSTQSLKGPTGSEEDSVVESSPSGSSLPTIHLPATMPICTSSNELPCPKPETAVHSISQIPSMQGDVYPIEGIYYNFAQQPQYVGIDQYNMTAPYALPPTYAPSQVDLTHIPTYPHPNTAVPYPLYGNPSTYAYMQFISNFPQHHQLTNLQQANIGYRQLPQVAYGNPMGLQPHLFGGKAPETAGSLSELSEAPSKRPGEYSYANPRKQKK